MAMETGGVDGTGAVWGEAWEAGGVGGGTGGVEGDGPGPLSAAGWVYVCEAERGPGPSRGVVLSSNHGCGAKKCMGRTKIVRKG